MTRSAWKNKMTQSKKPHLRYDYKGTYALYEIESIGELLISNYDNKDECNVEFNIKFKSGNTQKIDFDFPKQFKTKPVKGLFGTRLVTKPVSIQYYFNNIEKIDQLSGTNDIRKTINKMWKAYLKSEK